ncbi:MAG: acetyl-CoA carboxylase biotin carboxyl carrier protein [Bryobacteraceae bacterium]|nr:acetyl-CoA carboxylase biotin carboxyl carrier protein [Bryobacteraceae bacterium]
MTLDEIRDLIKTVCETGIAELEVQRGDNRVWIKRAGGTVSQEVVVSQTPASNGAPFAQISVPPAAPSASDTAGASPDEPDLTDPTLKAVNAPIVGTYYESASPGAERFVRAGDYIKPGKILCIIESMKLMNEIEAEISGTIVKCLVENGQPVEYGETLFLVKPN